MRSLPNDTPDTILSGPLESLSTRIRALIRHELDRVAFPGLLQAILILWLHSRATPFLAYLIMGPAIRSESYYLLPLTFLLVQLVAVLPGPLLAITWGRRNLSDLISLRPVPWTFWPSFLVATLGISVLTGCLILSLLQTGLIKIPTNLANSPDGGFMTSPLVLVIGASVSEELLFRGILLKGFLRHYHRGLAVAMSAVLFGLAHGNIGQFVSATTFGLFIGWIFAETGSLWPCLFAHGLTNGLPESWGPAFGLTLGSPAEARAWIIGIGLLAFGVWWCARWFSSQPLRMHWRKTCNEINA